jgi:hypothetical protein
MKKVFLTFDNVENKNSVVYDRMVDLNNYYNFPVPGWDFETTTDLNLALNQLADQEYEYVVVSILGNFLRLGSINDDIILDCQTNNTPLSAHLLDRNGYYNIDPQFFCLNLTIWNQVGRPKFVNATSLTTFTSIAVLRSEENFHDDYTPYWLAPGDQQIEYNLGDKEFRSMVYRREFGSVVVQRFLEHGYTVINVNPTIRERKVCLYPNANYNELLALINNPNCELQTIPLQRYQQHIEQLFQEDLYTVYVLNSEDVMSDTVGAIDHYAGVCGGLKAVAILHKNGFHAGTTVNLFDISEPALDYQRYLVQNWDGDFFTYQTTSEQYQAANKNCKYAWRSWNTWDNEIFKFLKSAGMTRAEFKTVWQDYCQLDISYTPVNLLDTAAVTEFFGKQRTGNFYVWTSNAYHMEHTVARHGTAWLQDKSQHLRTVLGQLDTTVWLEEGNQLFKLK